MDSPNGKYYIGKKSLWWAPPKAHSVPQAIVTGEGSPKGKLNSGRIDHIGSQLGNQHIWST